jgi:hypothetical protein
LSDQIECVYLVGCEASTLVKIGRSVDVQARLYALRTMSPVPLTLLWQTLGGAELETALHRRFESCRSHGEWFDFSDGDAVAQVVQALPEIAAEMQRVQRQQVARTARQAAAAKAAEDAIRTVVPIDRDRIRLLLVEDPSLNAGDVARALGRDNSGTLRTVVSSIRAELGTDGDYDDVEAACEGLAAVATGEPVVPWEDAKARLFPDDEPTN